MEEKYSNESDPTKRQIIRDFSIIREEKEKDLRSKIEDAYHKASLIYMFDEHLLNADTFKGVISDTQRKLTKNIYTKRLATQLSESLVSKIFSHQKEDLFKLFSGNDFKFFDSHGNFTGDHLKVVEEINAKLKPIALRVPAGRNGTRKCHSRRLRRSGSSPTQGAPFNDTLLPIPLRHLKGTRLIVRPPQRLVQLI